MFTVLSASELTSLIIVLAVAASVSGFIAGLLGVGGGIIMVPALYYAFTVMDFDIATRMHLSLGTSLAIIIPTSIMSAKTHMKFNAVDFKLIKSFGVFIVLGVILGTVLASNLKTPPLILFFSFFAFLVGIFFIFFREKVGANPRPISQTFKAVIGMGLGFFAVPLGIGGGSLGVPAMRLFGYPIKIAIGTSAAIGFLISIFGLDETSLLYSSIFESNHLMTILIIDLFFLFLSYALALLLVCTSKCSSFSSGILFSLPIFFKKFFCKIF